MTDNVQGPTENAFLKFLEKLAANNKKTVGEIAKYCHYTTEGIEFLKQNPWFKPSSTILQVMGDDMEDIDAEEIEWTEDLVWEMEDICDANLLQDHDSAQEELSRLLDLLPDPAYDLIVEMARKEVEIGYCFEGPDFPEHPMSDF